MTVITRTSSRTARLLLIGCSSLALSVPAAANEMIFSSSGAQLQVGQRTSQSSGVTQIALTGGGMVSIVDSAEYTINADGSIDLYKGSITVSGGNADDVVVRMPEGLEGRVSGTESSASFSVADDGEASGHTLGGDVSVGRNGRGMRKFSEGMMWSAAPGRAPRRAIANDAVAQPDRASSAPSEPQPPQVAAIGGDAGPVAAAVNGIPVTLGDGLAAAGASSDIIDAGRRVEAAVANPSIETFPSGDFALLIAAAAQLEGAYGGRPFNAAQADVIRAYLRFLASGGAQADFLTAYSGFVLNYLDLIRAGGVPSGFSSGVATAADVDAYLAFIGRTGAIANLAARDRALADAYLAFIASGGNRDLFAASFTDLTAAYFAFLRAGGVPGDFTGASQDALAQSIAFLRQSGLDQQLSDADRALITAFLENGGIAFAAQFQTALDAYFAYLASGQLPSDYDALDQATLRSYLETLANTGLLEAVLADQASFYADYLAFLRAGGDVDAFAGLPANIFAGYAVQLDAYFAFLAAGNLPSQFNAADIAQLQAFILELQAAGALDRFVGANQAAFFASFGQFVANGGAFDNFAGLNANIFAGYAVDLQAYFDFLANGGIPSAYTILSQETIEAYIAALEAAGATDRFLVDLADFYQAYFQFVLGGGNPDNFAGLPVPPDFPAFADALNAYAAFLAANGLPSDYSDEDIARLQAFFTSVLQSGQANALLGDNADLLTAYFAFLADGGQIDGFAGLPIYLDYVVALNAYAAFLAGGGLPSEYAALDLSVLRAYLDALAALPGGLAGFDALADNAALVSAYFAFVSGGGDIDGFTGLPIYADYVAALNAYFEFLANGGLPSDYTALDLAILEAYLAALAALQGGLAGFDDLNDFFVDYYAFLLGGGDPDQFAGLPGNGGGGNGGGNPSLATTIPGVQFFASLGGGANRPGLTTLEVAEDGQILDATINGATVSIIDALNVPFDERGWEVLSAGRFENTVAYTSYLDRDSGLGSNFVLNMLAGVPTVVLPQSGVVSYRLVGGSAPTDRDAAPGTQGYFTGNLGVAYGGTAPRVGVDFEVTSSGTTYATGTPGGAASPTNGGLIVDSTGRFRGLFPASAIAGTGCLGTPGCSSFIDGGIFGEDASHVGFVYFLNDFDVDGPRIFLSGSAVFGREGTALDGLGTLFRSQGGTGGGTGGGNTGGGNAGTAIPNQLIAYAGADVGIDLREKAEVTYNAEGAPIGYVSRINDFTAENERPTIGTATAMEAGSRGDGLIGWTRWANGQGGGRYFNDTDGFTLPANGGFHIVAVDPATNLPTGGQITYELAGATNPTVKDASLAPGTFAGTMAIAFGAAPTADFNFTVGIGGSSYNFGASGRPIETSGDFANQFGANSMAVNGAGSVCPTGACQANMRGVLGGVGATAVGVSYNFAEAGNENLRTYGAAAFVAPGVGTSSASGALTTASVAPSIAPIAGGDWSRWMGAPGANAQTIGSIGAEITFDSMAELRQTVAGAEDRPATAARRDLAIEQVERLMGGMITFGGKVRSER